MALQSVSTDPRSALPRTAFRPWYAWTVFALTFGLMLSDYMTRNVISAVFPLLKKEWALNDGQLGALVSVVALVVGLASWPVALLADRWGRVKSITAMAALWCLATIGCGISQNHTQMLVARGLVGLGEAGYGSAGGAILAYVFPPQMRAMILGAFLAAALFGSVLGVAIGGVVAASYGWRIAFIAVGAASLMLVVLYPLIVRDYPTVALSSVDRAATGDARKPGLRGILRELFFARSAIFTFVGSGLQMFIVGVISAWIPSFLSREYGLPADQAALKAALVVLVAGVGMIVGGALADQLARRSARHKLFAPASYAFITFALLTTAFSLPAGSAQMAFLFAGVLLAGAHSGVAGAVIADVTHPGLRATALATVVLFNNLLGLAPGPFFVGVVSDMTSLKTALVIAPAASLLAGVCFLLAARSYSADRLRFHVEGEAAAQPAPTPVH